jgi:hypothetical protein
VEFFIHILRFSLSFYYAKPFTEEPWTGSHADAGWTDY